MAEADEPRTYYDQQMENQERRDRDRTADEIRDQLGADLVDSNPILHRTVARIRADTPSVEALVDACVHLAIEARLLKERLVELELTRPLVPIKLEASGRAFVFTPPGWRCEEVARHG